ncbi:MAG: hypothetical protein H7Y10_06765 [Flavobacterium sp.]|nr:hypothetical protein [Flavobacterium sp.]
MNRIYNFLELFRRKEFYYSEDIEFVGNAHFKKLGNENILDITKFVAENITEVKNISDRKNRLKEEKSIECISLDSLVLEIKKTIDLDKVTSSQKYNDFTYFIDLSIKNRETLWVCNAIKSNPSESIVYPIMFIRKWNGKYYCWNTKLEL